MSKFTKQGKQALAKSKAGAVAVQKDAGTFVVNFNIATLPVPDRKFHATAVVPWVTETDECRFVFVQHRAFSTDEAQSAVVIEMPRERIVQFAESLTDEFRAVLTLSQKSAAVQPKSVTASITYGAQFAKVSVSPGIGAAIDFYELLPVPADLTLDKLQARAQIRVACSINVVNQFVVIVDSLKQKMEVA